MSFEDVLRRRVGPMRELMRWGEGRKAGEVKLAGRFARRALGVDLRVRPEEAWGGVELAGPRGEWHAVSRELALAIAGQTSWTRDLPASEVAWAVERDLLYHSAEDPGAPLAGEAGVLARGGPIARRSAMWPTLAVETATEIAPMPFMPRGRDLIGASAIGLRLASRERGHEVFSATLLGGERTGRVLRALVPLLDGSRDEAGVLAALPAAERAYGAKLLAWLDGITALTSAPVPRWRAGAEPRVTWLGHAAVLIEHAGKRILVDPLFFAPSDPPERYLSAPRFDPRTLPPIDLVLITHGDNDHLNPTSLLSLPADTPVVIPKVATQAEPWQVDIRGVLELLGFSRVIELDTYDSLELGALRVTACPFEGEDWELELPKATYLVEGPELGVYLSADADPSEETWRWVAERRIDVAFLGVSGCAEAFAAPRELGYGNFYEPWIPAERRMEWVRHTAGPRESARGASIVRPRFAFGYAAGGASYIRTAYSDVGDHESFAALLEEGVAPAPLSLGVPWSVPPR